MSGWRSLARAYPAPEQFSGALLSWRVARIGGVSYNNCFNIGADGTGLRCSVVVFFRVGHPDFLVPWSDIRIEHTRVLFIFRYVRLTFRKVPGTYLEIPAKVASELAARSRGYFQIPEG